jgi:manganese containing catalase
LKKITHSFKTISSYIYIFSFRLVYKYTPHGVDVYPQSAAGVPFNANCLACKGDAIANLQEDLAAEQKARATYEKLIDLCRDNPDVVDPLRFLREREVVHFQRFGEALRGVQDKLAEKKFYMNDGSCLDMQQNDCNC